MVSKAAEELCKFPGPCPLPLSENIDLWNSQFSWPRATKQSLTVNWNSNLLIVLSSISHLHYYFKIPLISKWDLQEGSHFFRLCVHFYESQKEKGWHRKAWKLCLYFVLPCPQIPCAKAQSSGGGDRGGEQTAAAPASYASYSAAYASHLSTWRDNAILAPSGNEGNSYTGTHKIQAVPAAQPRSQI